jgi:hypothetical protein
MTTFKKRLKEAIKSVLCDMSSLSNEEIRAEVKSYLVDNRASALFYAWDYNVPGQDDSIDAKFDWKRFLPEISNCKARYGKAPSLFGDEQVDEDMHQNDWHDTHLASDDYFEFRAAA